MKIGKYKIEMRFVLILLFVIFILGSCFNGEDKLSDKKAEEIINNAKNFLAEQKDEIDFKYNMVNDAEKWNTFYEEVKTEFDNFNLIYMKKDEDSKPIYYTKDEKGERVLNFNEDYKNVMSALVDANNKILELLELYNDKRQGEEIEEEEVKRIEEYIKGDFDFIKKRMQNIESGDE